MMSLLEGLAPAAGRAEWDSRTGLRRRMLTPGRVVAARHRARGRAGREQHALLVSHGEPARCPGMAALQTEMAEIEKVLRSANS